MDELRQVGVVLAQQLDPVEQVGKTQCGNVAVWELRRIPRIQIGPVFDDRVEYPSGSDGIGRVRPPESAEETLEQMAGQTGLGQNGFAQLADAGDGRAGLLIRIHHVFVLFRLDGQKDDLQHVDVVAGEETDNDVPENFQQFRRALSLLLHHVLPAAGQPLEHGREQVGEER